MPITRAKASSLLNQKEMALYDDSRINGLRQLDARGLDSRIKRARTARDRARDLVQKHKLASRASTGSKRGSSGQANQRSKDKAELMADILQRFERRLKEVEREAAPAQRAATRKTSKAAKTAKPARAAGRTSEPAKKAARKATKKATPGRTPEARSASAAPARKRAGAGEPGKRAATAAQAATGTAAAQRPAATKSTRKRAGKTTRKRRITPEQALAQTQALLEAKQAQDAAPKPWQDAPGGGVAEGQPGYQSGAAKRRALHLHQAEARIPAIQGSVSTRDRINQGKRDHRGDDNGD